MFEMPQTDLFSEYRNFLTGVELCLERAARPPRPAAGAARDRAAAVGDRRRPPGPHVPHAAAGTATIARVYNEREQRATRFNGISSLRIGLPIAVLGLLLTWTAVRATDEDSAMPRSCTDHVGWVLAWIGLWFPLDACFFYPLTYGRENRVLALLARPRSCVPTTWCR